LARNFKRLPRFHINRNPDFDHLGYGNHETNIHKYHIPEKSQRPGKSPKPDFTKSSEAHFSLFTPHFSEIKSTAHLKKQGFNSQTCVFIRENYMICDTIRPLFYSFGILQVS